MVPLNNQFEDLYLKNGPFSSPKMSSVWFYTICTNSHILLECSSQQTVESVLITLKLITEFSVKQKELLQIKWDKGGYQDAHQL